MSPFWKVTPFQGLNWLRRFDTTNFGNKLSIEAYRTPKEMKSHLHNCERVETRERNPIKTTSLTRDVRYKVQRELLGVTTLCRLVNITSLPIQGPSHSKTLVGSSTSL